MKFSIISWLVLLIFFQENFAKMIISDEIIDLGTFKQKDLKSAIFLIKNVGKYPLILKSVAVECECTLVKWNKKSIPPEGSTKIEVIYSNKYLGHFQKSVTIETNTEQKISLLLIRGKVIP